MANYPYSSELKKQQDTSQVNYEDPKTLMGIKKMAGLMTKMEKTFRPSRGVKMSRRTYTSYDGVEIPYFLLEPKKTTENASPCIIYYHGGGFMFPIQKVMIQVASFYVQHMNCKVVLPDFRISFDNTCKDIMEDCIGMYRYVFEHCKELSVDPNQIIVYGDSAGGALAAGTLLLARDRKLPLPIGQMLLYPVTDCHSERYESVRQYPDAVWPANANRSMWKLMFEKGTFDMEKYVAPMNHEDVSGMPQTYVEPQEIDILRDEAIAYGKKLEEAGVPVEVNVIPGSYHGVEADWKSPLTQRLLTHRVEVMQKMLLK